MPSTPASKALPGPAGCPSVLKCSKTRARNARIRAQPWSPWGFPPNPQHHRNQLWRMEPASCYSTGLDYSSCSQHSLSSACKFLPMQCCQPEGQMAQPGRAHSSETRRPTAPSLCQGWAARSPSSAFGDLGAEIRTWGVMEPLLPVFTVVVTQSELASHPETPN